MGTPFAPAQHSESLRETIEESVSAAITTGELPPGELVSVPALAAQFQVSATPVREAMLNLQKLGFVEPVRNKGFRVTEVSMRDLEEIVEVRRMLEAPAVARLAAAYPAEHDARLRALAERIVTAADSGDLAQYIAADVVFHLELLALLDNRRLVQVVAMLRRQTRLTGLAGLQNTLELHESAAEHERMLDLLAAGDGPGAEALMYTHIGHVVGWWAGRPEQDSQSARAAR